MKTLVTMITACLSLCLSLMLQGAFASAQAVNASGHCTGMTVVDYLSSDHQDITNSGAWLNISDGHLNFTTSSIGCVMITFSAPATATATADGSYNMLRVRTLLDGNNLCVPALYSDSFSSDAYPAPQTASSITRICKNVAAGAHTVQVQYSRNPSGPTLYVAIYSHVLAVTHN